MGEILHLEHERCLWQRGDDLVEEGGVMATPQVELAQDVPTMGRNQATLLIGVMGENELAIGTSPNVNLDGIGYGSRGQGSSQGVIRESGGPSPVTDDQWRVTHLEKLVYK
jgi:hypothetical protein